MATVSAYAPGRVELLGNHTDYNGGVVLAAAIDRGVNISGQARADDRIILTSHERVEVSASDGRAPAANAWANYPLGVVKQFQRAGYAVGGFEANIASDLPAGMGLASSAAIEVATAGLLMRLQNLKLAPLDVARLCQRAENEFVGVESGMLDQATSVFGRADHLVYLDFQSEEIQLVPFPRELALVIASSGTGHNLRESQYNIRRRECRQAAAALGVPTLRDATRDKLENARAALDPILYRRAVHIMDENRRVEQALAALAAGNETAVGELMDASHESSRTNFENSTPELDALTERARSLPGVLGARLTGGGFGGGMVALVRLESAPAIAEALAAPSAAGSDVLICRPADGAMVRW